MWICYTIKTPGYACHNTNYIYILCKNVKMCFSIIVQVMRSSLTLERSLLLIIQLLNDWRRFVKVVFRVFQRAPVLEFHLVTEISWEHISSTACSYVESLWAQIKASARFQLYRNVASFFLRKKNGRGSVLAHEALSWSLSELWPRWRRSFLGTAVLVWMSQCI